MSRKLKLLPGRMSKGLLRLFGMAITFLFTWFVYASGQIITATGKSASAARMQPLIPAYGDLKKEMLMQKLIAVDVNARIRVSEDEAEDYFNEHRNNYKAESRVRVAQIVVRDLAKAEEVAARLNAGGDFAKIATEVSIGPEARRGGDLGFITRQIMPEPLDDAIFNLPVNKISPVVQSPYGFHIFKVLEIKPAGIKNFAEIKEDVIADIRAHKEDAAFISWLEALKIKAVIKKETSVLRKK